MEITEITTNYLYRSTINPADLANLFTYHAPKGDQTLRYEAIREKAKELAVMLLTYCPPSADTTAAIRHLREAIMIANASIAIGE